MNKLAQARATNAVLGTENTRLAGYRRGIAAALLKFELKLATLVEICFNCLPEQDEEKD